MKDSIQPGKSQERQIMLVMRKVLTQIIKDTTPAHRSMRHVLQDSTIEDIRQCLGLISLRERELAQREGVAQEKPHFVDEKTSAEVVPISSIKRPGKDE
jgi:hypothetical protein